jgi:hypothetical protein
LALHGYAEAKSVVKDRDVWENVVQRLQNGEMPPKKKSQPTQAERDAVVAWLQGELSTSVCTDPPNPGRVTMRRLNRAEYNNTVRDLLGVDFHPADNFPDDDVGYGFDNIGDVLSLSPLLLEKYLTAADDVVAKAFAPEMEVPTARLADAYVLRSTGRTEFVKDSGKRVFDGELYTTFTFPRDGDYVLRLRAYPENADGDPIKITVKVDDREQKTLEVRPAGRGGRRAHDVKARVPGGPHKIAWAIATPTKPDDRKADETKDETKDGKEKAAKGRRALVVSEAAFEGPTDVKAKGPSASYRRVMIGVPGAELSKSEAARRILANFLPKAFRRPVTPDEVTKYVRLVELADSKGGSFEEGIRLALQAVLVSPHFLYRIETDRQVPGRTGADYPLNDFELANRLSYFLWASMPDDELFHLAEQGKLRQDGNLEAQVRRMLKDAKSKALGENFAGQWLQTRNLKTMAPDPKLFPYYDDQLRSAMVQETTLFFDAVVREDRSILDFIAGDFTYVNERLARHYGIPEVRGEAFQRVSLAGTKRAGILTQASVLTVTSNPTRTSPVKRGKFILENVLGVPPPPPPPDVPDLSEEKQAVASGSLRQRMEQHRTNPNCASCHARMDPLGFGFENFDAIGSWRTKDGSFAIDPSGTLPDGKTFQGPDELRNILLQKDEMFRKCLAEKLLTYALGRGLEYYDRCALESISQKAAQHQNKFSELVIAIVQSDPFLLRRAATPGGK